MIILYSTHCPRCNVLTKKLDSAGIKYKLIDDQDEMIKKGITTVPMLEVNKRMMDFATAVKWINAGGQSNGD